jgi:hypothetical protein
MTLQLKIHINPEYQKLVPEMPAPEFAAILAFSTCLLGLGCRLAFKDL